MKEKPDRNVVGIDTHPRFSSKKKEGEVYKTCSIPGCHKRAVYGHMSSIGMIGVCADHMGVPGAGFSGCG